MRYVDMYGYDFWPYLDEAQHIDANYDIVPTNALTDYIGNFYKLGLHGSAFIPCLTEHFGLESIVGDVTPSLFLTQSLHFVCDPQ